MEVLFTEIKRRELAPEQLDSAEKAALVGQALDEAARRTGLETDENAETAYRMDRWRDFFLLYLDYLGEKGLQDGFVPAAFEVSFGSRDAQITRIPLDDAHALQLTGQIDRIDVREQDEADYLRVVDYKTKKNTTFEPVDLTEGRQLQLAVYLDMALRLYAAKHPEKKIRPGAIGYASLAEPLAEWVPPELRREALWKELSLSGLTAQEVMPPGTGGTKKMKSSRELELVAAFARDRLTRLGRQVYGGNVTPAPWGPKDRGSCTYCAYAEACPFDETRKDCRYRYDTRNKEEAWTLIRETGAKAAPAQAEDGEEADHGIQ